MDSPIQKILVLVRSEYWTEEVSRYRNGIAAETIIPSLRQQVLRDDTARVPREVFLQSCIADPYWQERVDVFRRANAEPWWRFKAAARNAGYPHLLIEVPDDLILTSNALQTIHDDAVELIERHGRSNNPVYINMLSGGVWEDGQVYPMQIDIGSLPIRVKLVRSKYDNKSFRLDCMAGLQWLQPVHQQMDCVLPAGWGNAKVQSCGDQLKHIHTGILSRYCSLRMATATAQHATIVLPRRTKSMYFLQARRGRRR